MTERESDAIRAMLNFARSGVVTWAALKRKMLADGWSAEEAHQALAAIDPKVLPVDDKMEGQS